jgi:hypothetical protein
MQLWIVCFIYSCGAEYFSLLHEMYMGKKAYPNVSTLTIRNEKGK